LTSTKLAEKIAKLAWDKKGKDITLLDLKGLTDISDYFVVISGESEPHVKAISDFIEEELKKEGIKVWHREGKENLNWILLDYVEVVAHIFRPPIRDFYSLEKLWGDARITRLEEDVPHRALSETKN
jgi:ribosome-associated protein